jgi:hypothetical protein
MSRQPRSEIFYADRYISSADGISEEEVCEEEERHVQERVERRGEERRPQRERSASRDRGTAEVSEDDRTDRPRRKRTVSKQGYSNTNTTFSAGVREWEPNWSIFQTPSLRNLPPRSFRIYFNLNFPLPTPISICTERFASLEYANWLDPIHRDRFYGSYFR